ncbi:uncharacterized protein BO88DRAFT_134625 [Aspergillus vadensis CBS 113365]|uniref:Uncharacterized protein n=1 Tax=Aspergillus vadensis (strain CBS 113365 / IMI 142717 / IBT 24658) TaxID=1448311 RepID=A0A319B5T6_ASPVC|nr:hypothetical protein BO88DRAFT_134625 [Aspergillus vadensis CBS 113365]PYH65640.1 hypothetical protein BO88DRAFT_134625 [Aspergillus vadensis CBS 113365]
MCLPPLSDSLSLPKLLNLNLDSSSSRSSSPSPPPRFHDRHHHHNSSHHHHFRRRRRSNSSCSTCSDTTSSSSTTTSISLRPPPRSYHPPQPSRKPPPPPAPRERERDTYRTSRSKVRDVEETFIPLPPARSVRIARPWPRPRLPPPPPPVVIDVREREREREYCRLPDVEAEEVECVGVFEPEERERVEEWVVMRERGAWRRPSGAAAIRERGRWKEVVEDEEVDEEVDRVEEDRRRKVRVEYIRAR